MSTELRSVVLAGCPFSIISVNQYVYILLSRSLLAHEQLLFILKTIQLYLRIPYNKETNPIGTKK